jgi:uncharacterized protein YhhL (DUF1145 family)
MKNLYKYLFYLTFVGFGALMYTTFYLLNVFSPFFEATMVLLGLMLIIFLFICIELITLPGEERKHENVESNNSCEE